MKRTIILTAILLLVIVICALAFADNTATAAFSEGKGLILIDVGHGGMDGGAVGVSGKKESELNLEIALRLEQVLKRSGYDVLLTRSDADALAEDKQADMAKRRQLIRKSGQLAAVSIHQNFFTDTSCTGAQVFYDENSAAGKALADEVQSALNEELMPDKKRTAASGDYYIVKSGEPVIIVECGFISNQEEEQRLNEAGYQLRIAKAIKRGITSYLDKNGGTNDENS